MLMASPIPRVPPVTIATRAMSLSQNPKNRRALWMWQPPCKLAGNQRLKHGHALGRIVEAFEAGEPFATSLQECLTAADSELLDGLHAIGGKTGRGDGHSCDAFRGIGCEYLVRRGLKPLRAAEA